VSQALPALAAQTSSTSSNCSATPARSPSRICASVARSIARWRSSPAHRAAIVSDAIMKLSGDERRAARDRCTLGRHFEAWEIRPGWRSGERLRQRPEPGRTTKARRRWRATARFLDGERASALTNSSASGARRRDRRAARQLLADSDVTAVALTTS
jgi:hypothetical protein